MERDHTERLEYETEHYYLCIAPGDWDSACKGYPVYKLVNKITHLVEGEAVSLPDALKFMVNRTVELNEVLEYLAAEAATVEAPDTFH